MSSGATTFTVRRAAVLTLGVMLLHGAIAPSATSSAPAFAIPLPLLEELADFHTSIGQAVRAGGKTGAAAARVMALLEPHIATERRDAFPLLRALPALAADRVDPWMEELLPLADRLRDELPALHDDHVALAYVLTQLSDAAWSENLSQFAFVATRLRRHLQIEEQILYPAALVTADAIRDKAARGSR